MRRGPPCVFHHTTYTRRVLYTRIHLLFSALLPIFRDRSERTTNSVCGSRMHTVIQKRFNSVSVTSAGDSFQVVFESGEDKSESDCFLLQCQFEDPGAGDAYALQLDGQSLR